MRPKLLLRSVLLIAPVALLTGCVGFNTALFMTKSNVGLDLDMKPPTAEINISRKEAVVEPSFEGGQTPPVMASFSTKVGHDKMESFFLGVNQTFAGGDAAVTMAKLYDRKDDFTDVAAANFDSGLTLSEPPKSNAKKGFLGWRKKLFGLAEPGEVRPFFFGTDTQFGMKVAWNGVGGPYPDTVKLGFNRKEIAVAPVTISELDVVRIPSFLATVDGGGKGSLTGGTNALGVKQEVNWIQYFATGKSADHLARQYGVRKAMLERADPKAAIIGFADKYVKDDCGDCLRGFWQPDGATVNTNNAAVIRTWMQTNSFHTVTADLSIPALMRGTSLKELRCKAVADLNVECPK